MLSIVSLATQRDDVNMLTVWIMVREGRETDEGNLSEYSEGSSGEQRVRRGGARGVR